MATRSITHASLLEALRDHEDERAWRAFYERYRRMLLFAAKRTGLNDADAQDTVSDVLADFVSAFQQGVYEPGRGRLRLWLKGILRNKVRQLRERRRIAATHAKAVGTAAAERADDQAAVDQIDAMFDREWRLERLNQALAVFRAESDIDDFQALDLYALKRWPAKRVAAFLGVTPNVVYLAKSRGMKRLRELLRDIEANED